MENNVQKMREIIKGFADAFCGDGIVYGSEVDDLLQQARSALALPLRQCDIGTAEEQEKRWKRNCGHGIPGCCKCVVYAEAKKRGLVNKNLMICDCKFIWAQMPYEGGGAE